MYYIQNMKWKHPPTIKIYEALGCIADDRIEIKNNSAKVYSSTKNKFYDVNFDPVTNSIMANDNGSYWKGYLGYPAIAYLMKSGIISYDQKLGTLLANIAWKDINQKFKNDFDKTLQFILSSKTQQEISQLSEFVAKVENEISNLAVSVLGKRMAPPDGY